MTDYNCGVCSEPWSFYHIHHDAPKWVKNLFIKGLGCECCEGVSPIHTEEFLEETQLNHAKSILFNGEGEHETEAFEALEREARVFDGSQWGEPASKLKWQCASCELKRFIDCEGESFNVDGYWKPFYADRNRSASRDTEHPHFIPGSKLIDKETGKLEVFCDGCWNTCCSGSDCDNPCISGPYGEGLDYYSPGSIHFDPSDAYLWNPYCFECYERCRSHCGCDFFHDEDKHDIDACELATYHDSACEERERHLEWCGEKEQFMEPQFYRGPVIEVETNQGTFFCKAENFFDIWDLPNQEIFSKSEPEERLIARLNAPGFLDCTEWAPLDNEEEIDDWVEDNIQSDCEVYLESLKKEVLGYLAESLS